MERQKKAPGTFTSLRIIGEKAQKLIAKARSLGRQTPDTAGGEKTLVVPAPFPAVMIHLSMGSVVRAAFAIAGIALGILLVILLQDKIVLLLLALFVAAVADPGAKALGRLGLPRGVAMLLLYVVALALFLFLLLSLIPILADQIRQIAIFTNSWVNDFLAAPSINLPLLGEELNMRLTLLLKSALGHLSIAQFTDALQQIAQNLAVPAGSLLFLARVAGSVFNFFVNLILVLVLAFFLQIEKEKIIAWVRSFLPPPARAYADDKAEMVTWRLGQWARGQLLLCFSVGVLVFLALVILRMPYALTLGILAFFMEFIPVIGIFAAAVPAVLIAATQQGFVWAVMLACIYYVIQWCESNLLAPLIMKRTVGLSPIAVLLAMLVGISFPSVINPVLGIMLAIPLCTIVALFLEDWRERRVKNG